MTLKLAILFAVVLGSATVDSPAVASAGPAPAPAEHLRFVLLLSRHGVRSPTWTNARLDAYSAQPWPVWPVGPGLLTPHGKRLMRLLGQYDRAAFAEQGLFPAAGCDDADRVYINADTDERTVETGHGLADGLFPGCGVPVHEVAPGAQGELFHHAGGVGRGDPERALAAVAGRIGDDPSALLPAFRQPLDSLQQMLACPSQASCAAAPHESLLAIPPTLSAGAGDHLVDLKGPLQTAATFAENLQLEYLEGMPLPQVGWGHLDEAGVRAAMVLHAGASDLLQRTPYLAQVQGSNLLLHILQTLDQARQGKPLPGALGTPSSRLTILVGHDTNLAAVAALLNAHWLVNGYQRDDAAPGGALMFSLWQRDGQPDQIRVSYVVQTPKQMREEVALQGGVRPAAAPIFLPGCSSAETGSPCEWPAFNRVVQEASDHHFYTP